VRRTDCRVDGVDIVPVDRRDDVPAIRRKAPRRVVGEPAFGLAVDRDPVVVVERDEPRESQRSGERRGFVRDALHQAAVAHEHVRAVIDDGLTRTIERLRQQPLGKRHPDRVGESLPEWAGRGLDAGCDAGLRMSRRFGMELAEALELLHRQIVAGEMQQRVLQHRAMSVRQHEAIAIDPMRIARVVTQVARPERHGDLGHPHRHARVSGLRGFDCVHRECADCVCKLAVGRFRARRHGSGSDRSVGHGVKSRSKRPGTREKGKKARKRN